MQGLRRQMPLCWGVAQDTLQRDTFQGKPTKGWPQRGAVTTPGIPVIRFWREQVQLWDKVALQELRPSQATHQPIENGPIPLSPTVPHLLPGPSPGRSNEKFRLMKPIMGVGVDLAQ